MVKNNNGMLMEQKIFELGLSVEIVSVYLLCIGLAESDIELKFPNMISVWSGAEEELIAGLLELEKLKIIEKDSENNVTQLFNAAMWKIT